MAPLHNLLNLGKASESERNDEAGRPRGTRDPRHLPGASCVIVFPGTSHGESMQWRVANGQWPMANGQWPVATEHVLSPAVPRCRPQSSGKRDRQDLDLGKAGPVIIGFLIGGAYSLGVTHPRFVSVRLRSSPFVPVRP